MQFAIEAVIRTPVWVWALLAFLLFIGIRGLRPTVASFGRLLILPAVFLVWGLSGFATSYGFRPIGIAVWLAALVVGAGIGWLVARSIEIHADKERGFIRLPGTTVNLVLILIIFATKYTLGVQAGMRPRSPASCSLWQSTWACPACSPACSPAGSMACGGNIRPRRRKISQSD